MEKLLGRLAIVCLLLVALGLALTRPPTSFYPRVEIEAVDPAGMVVLGFLVDALPGLSECERVTGNIARQTLALCPSCRVTRLECVAALDAGQQLLLSAAPLDVPSGRTRNGVITFRADSPDLALAACRSAEAQAARGAVAIKCYPAQTKRTPLPKASPFGHWSFPLLGIAFLAAWLAGWFIIRYEHLHAHVSHDHVDSGPQKYHTHPTPRIGGLIVVSGLLGGGGVILFADALPAEQAFGLLLLAALPAFLGGLVEDVTKRVGVFERLLLTMLSGATAAWLLGAVLPRLDFPWVDQAMAWVPFAVVLTTVAVGGTANAINIIDGYNGLAGGFALIVLFALAFVANGVGDALVFNTALVLAGAIGGFLVWNWPRGRIFFGDGGAYLVGFMLAELSILLVLRNLEVSPWFPLLLLVYPVFETFYSIYRRKLCNKLSPGQPDNQHLHHLIHDVAIRHRPGGQPFARNSRVAKYIWMPTLALAVCGCLFWSSTPVLAGCAAAFCVAYVIAYRYLAKRRPSRKFGEPCTG